MKNGLTKSEKNITTIIAFVFHLLAFSAISYGGYCKWGFSWWYVLTAVAPPIVFLLDNLQRDK